MNQSPPIPPPPEELIQSTVQQHLVTWLSTAPYKYIAIGIFAALIAATVLLFIRSPKVKKKGKSKTKLHRLWYSPKLKTVLLVLVAASGVVLVYNGSAQNNSPCPGRPFNYLHFALDQNLVKAQSPEQAIEQVLGSAPKLRSQVNISQLKDLGNVAPRLNKLRQDKNRRPAREFLVRQADNGKWAVEGIVECQ